MDTPIVRVKALGQTFADRALPVDPVAFVLIGIRVLCVAEKNEKNISQTPGATGPQSLRPPQPRDPDLGSWPTEVDDAECKAKDCHKHEHQNLRCRSPLEPAFCAVRST